MISEWLVIFILFVLGVLFDRAVLLIIQAQHNRPLTILLLTVSNNVMVLLCLVMVYFVHGFAVHPGYGEGWLDWVTLVEAFGAAYLPVSFGFVARVITKKEL